MVCKEEVNSLVHKPVNRVKACSVAEKFYRASCIGVLQGHATWEGNQVVWDKYIHFVTTIDLLNAWRDIFRGTDVTAFKICHTYKLTKDIVDAFKNSNTKKWTKMFHNFGVPNNVWYNYQMCTPDEPNEGLNGSIGFCTNAQDHSLIDFSVYPDCDKLTVEKMNELTFQYTFLHNFQAGGTPEMELFIDSFVPEKNIITKEGKSEGATARPKQGSAAGKMHMKAAAPREVQLPDFISKKRDKSDEEGEHSPRYQPYTPVEPPPDSPPIETGADKRRRIAEKKRAEPVYTDIPLQEVSPISSEREGASSPDDSADDSLFDGYVDGLIEGASPQELLASGQNARSDGERAEEITAELLRDPVISQLLDVHTDTLTDEIMETPSVKSLLAELETAVKVFEERKQKAQEIIKTLHKKLANERLKSERLLEIIEERVPNAQEVLATFQLDESRDSVRMAQIEQNITMLLSTLKK